MASTTSAIWIDVEDLFHYIQHNARLSGIQRLTYELYTALEARAAVSGRRIGYVRLDPRTDSFRVVRWSEVRALCHGLTVSHRETEAAQPAPSMQRAPRPGSLQILSRRAALYINHRLPPEARAPFHRFCTLQYSALKSLVSVGRAGMETVRDTLPQTERPPLPAAAAPPANSAQAGSIIAPGTTPGTAQGTARGAARGPARGTGLGAALRDVAAPGDWLLSLGASWHRTDYGALLHEARQQCRVRTGILFYDLIPLRRPEWCHHTLVETFGTWLNGVLPATDALFAISDATARDVEALLATRWRTVQVRTLPVGTGFPASARAVGRAAEHVPAHSVPKPGSYVLFVSTIEARKNHALMFQVWRRLAETLPPEALPTLVFAGRVGWLVADLMLQIANTNYCDGKLVIIEDPSDAVLMRLYEGCLFTVLPSLFEGWGLPVTESLAAGKPCVTSDNTSLPEAGAGLTKMIDAYDVNAATRLFHELLTDRPGLAAWEERVRRDFVPVPWTRSADALLDGLSCYERAGERR